MNNDTQPNDWWEREKARALAAIKWDESFGSRYPDEKQAYLQKWGPLAEEQYKQEEQTKQPEGQDAREMMQEAYERIHVHGPFTFLLNQNHNALRGCVTCGQAWIGLMAGEVKNLVWHPVGELEEKNEPIR